MQRIGDRIAELIKKDGYSQKEFANLVGVTEAAMSRYLKNDREPKIEVVARMAEILHTTTDYLIMGQKPVSDFASVYGTVVQNVHMLDEDEKLSLIKAIVGGN